MIISCRMEPSAKTSLRASISSWSASACSGGMKPAVPMTSPSRVAVSVSAARVAGEALSRILATPQSSTYTSPCGPSMMLSGFRSRG